MRGGRKSWTRRGLNPSACKADALPLRYAPTADLHHTHIFTHPFSHTYTLRASNAAHSTHYTAHTPYNTHNIQHTALNTTYYTQQHAHQMPTAVLPPLNDIHASATHQGTPRSCAVAVPATVAESKAADSSQLAARRLCRFSLSRSLGLAISLSVSLSHRLAISPSQQTTNDAPSPST